MVSVAYLAIAVWFIGGGWMAARAGVMPHGARLGAVAALYVGQPWWAYRWGRPCSRRRRPRAEHGGPSGVVADQPVGS